MDILIWDSENIAGEQGGVRKQNLFEAENPSWAVTKWLLGEEGSGKQRKDQKGRGLLGMVDGEWKVTRFSTH